MGPLTIVFTLLGAILLGILMEEAALVSVCGVVGWYGCT
jgi:hypothetical protein